MLTLLTPSGAAALCPPSQDGQPLGCDWSWSGGSGLLDSRSWAWSGLVSECPLLVSTTMWLILVGVKVVMLEPTAGLWGPCHWPPGMRPPFVISLSCHRPLEIHCFIKTSVYPFSGPRGTNDLPVELSWVTGWTLGETGFSNTYGGKSLWLFLGKLWTHFCRSVPNITSASKNNPWYSWHSSGPAALGWFVPSQAPPSPLCSNNLWTI